LGEALLWIEMLQSQINEQVETVIDTSWRVVMKGAPVGADSGQLTPRIESPTSEEEPPQSENESNSSEDERPSPEDVSSALNDDLSAPANYCERRLQQLCPACFGGSEFGTPFSKYDFSNPHDNS
jgi:hypothetical protein